MRLEPLSFERRFNGPPNSINGGVAAGALAERLGGAVKARLKRPVPFQINLGVRALDDRDGLAAHDEAGDILLAWREALSLEVPALPARQEIIAAAGNYVRADDNSYADCFVCGNARSDGDGLRVLAGPASDGGQFAALAWTPHANFGDEHGHLRERFIWAALDCPGAAAALLLNETNMLTGELHAEVLRPVRCGEAHTVFAWPIWSEGRKIFTGVALFDAHGELCAKASQLWITIGDSVA